jgi:hypothetical protein
VADCSAADVKARIAAGNFWYPCDRDQDPTEALLGAVGPEVFCEVMREPWEVARMRRIGVDPDRVIDGETALKEIDHGRQ